MASRLCAGAFYDCFCAGLFDGELTREQLEAVKGEVLRRFAAYAPPAESGGIAIKSAMIRKLPTTAAVAFGTSEEKGCTKVTAVWAGDSRVYVLDGRGLAQLSVDDTTVPDPMENIYQDGVLTNVFCGDRPVELHAKTVTMQGPFVVLTATDGCFGYVSTPMEFEGILLDTLMQARTPAQWETMMADIISSVAGDDHAMELAAFGYGDFDVIKHSFRDRYALLSEKYLRPVQAMEDGDREGRRALWQTYRADYLRFV